MIFTLEIMSPLFEFVDRTQGVVQSPLYHPEGCVLTHSMQVTELAFRETIDTDLILAALLHDIGKYESSHGHEKLAVRWLRPFCSVKTLWLIENHMRVWDYLFGTMKRSKKCRELIEHSWLPELIQLARWDYAGRVPGKRSRYDKSMIIDRLNKIAMRHFGENNGNTNL